MVFNARREIERLLEENPELREITMGTREYRKLMEAELGAPRPGRVVDNRDPLERGRVRVASDVLGPGVLTDWVPVLALGASNGCGWWQLPDIGTQVLMFFVGKGHQRPVVVGCMYSLKNRPPKHSTENPADSLVYQTKAHRLELIDEEGKESVILSTAKGQIRIELSKANGIKLVNELGDIKIKCRKLKVKGDEAVQIEGKKRVVIQGENVNIEAKNIKVKSGGEVSYNARSINIRGSRGVVAEGKQMAAAQDNVQGFDIHRMRIPSGNGTTVVPLPHPFLGRFADRLSPDVKINGQHAATEGSIAQHNSPVHNQLPGTIRFEDNPNRQGEVTGGTAKTVKINGKEAAVIGSTVTTCNDTGARNNSVVMAPGTHMPMPVIIHPKNTEAWKKEREERARHPAFADIMWNVSHAKEGQTVELIALVKDIEDGNMVTFRIWRVGQDPNSHIPLAQVQAVIEGGIAKGQWFWQHPQGQELPEGDPGFFFTAHSAWCPPKQSGELTVELRRPEITEITQEKIVYNDKGEETGTEESEKVEYGKQWMVKVKVKDVANGEHVNVKISCEAVGFSLVKAAEVKDGEAEVRFDARISRKALAQLGEGDELAFICEVETMDRRAKKGGGEITVVFTYIMKYISGTEVNHEGDEYTLESTDSAYKQIHDIQSDSVSDEGYTTITFTDVLPGKKYSLFYHNRQTGDEYPRFLEMPFSDLIFTAKGGL